MPSSATNSKTSGNGTVRSTSCSGGLFVARASQEARNAYRPIYQKFLHSPGAKRNQTPFTDVDDVIDNGPALIGSPEEVLDKVGRYHEAFGHDVLALGIESPGLTETQRRDSLDLFFGELAPQLREKYPAKIWNDTAPCDYPVPELKEAVIAGDQGATY